MTHRHGAFAIRRTAGGIALQQLGSTGVGSRGDQLGQGQRIAQAEVETLRADRVHGLGGIAHQHRARPGQPARRDAMDRIRMALAGPAQAAKTPAETPLHQFDETRIVQRGDRVRLLGGHGEHQPAAPFGQRQQRDRAVIGEPLPGAVGMLALGRDRADEQRLPVIMALGVDAQLRANEGSGAIGANQQRCVDAAHAIGMADLRVPAASQRLQGGQGRRGEPG